MSTGDLAVSLTIKLNDQGSAAAHRALKGYQRDLKDVEATAKSTSAAAVSAFKKLADSREVLGIRSEKAIQNEIRQTEAAYKRLVASGQAGARELARAQDAMRSKVQALRQEMEGASRAGISMGGALRGAAGVGAGFMAGRAVLQGPISQTMGYDLALRHVANTAFAGKSLDERRAGVATLNSDVMAAVRHGGGTREEALDTYSDIYGSGVYTSSATASAALRAAVYAGTATGARSRDMATIGMRARQNFGIDEARAYEIANASGKAGGFELRDMSKHLGSQMALAQGMTGMKGERAYASLLALNQAAYTTAGTKDEAALNVSNLLSKINSEDTAKDFSKIGVDLRGTLAKAAGKGVNPIDATLNLVEQIVGRDPRMKQLQKQLSTAPSAERGELIEAQMGIMKGSAIGKVFQDRQALLALLGGLNRRSEMREQVDSTLQSRGVIEGDHANIEESPAYKAQMLAAESANAMQTAMDKVNPTLGGMADGISGLMKDFPTFSAALMGGGTAAAALAAAATGASIALTALTKSAGGNVIPDKATVGKGVGKLLGRAAGAGIAWELGQEVGGLANDGINKVDKTLGTSIGTDIGRMVAYVMAGLGSKNAQQALQIEIDVKNGNIVAEVNRANAREAARK